MFRTTAVVIGIALFAGSAIAFADSGSLTDPKGDYPDIVRLGFKNASSKVEMTMTYSGGHPQNESFYLRWGSNGQRYQVFSSPSIHLNVLRFGGTTKSVPCQGLVIRRPSANTTTVAIPRSCLPKAPNTLRFQGIATEGTSSIDQTRISQGIKRG